MRECELPSINCFLQWLKETKEYKHLLVSVQEKFGNQWKINLQMIHAVHPKFLVLGQVLLLMCHLQNTRFKLLD